MHRERQRDPLVLLDAAIVMRVEIREAAIFIERVLLDIEAAGVDVRSENHETFLERLRADLEQHDGLLHVDGIDLVARLDGLAFGDVIRKVAIACCLRLAHGLDDTLALRLAHRQEVAVTRIELFELLLLLLGISAPDGLFFFFIFF